MCRDAKLKWLHPTLSHHSPIYRLGNIGYDAYHPSQQTDLKNLFYFQYLTVLKIAVFSVNNPARIFFIQLGTLITPTYRFIEIMKVRKMERAENSDLDTSLAPGKYGNILQEQEFRRKVPSEYANLRIQLGKEIVLRLEVDEVFV